MGPRVDLMFMPDSVMFVLSYPSGVVYCHQAGGVVCSQPSLEGVLVPLCFSTEGEARLMSLPYGIGLRMTDSIADAIDQILMEVNCTRYLVVDRSRLNESGEAWVWVRSVGSLAENDPSYYGSLYGLEEARGVLVWHNSD